MRESTTLLLACVVLLAIAPAALAFDTDGYKLATETILCDCGCHPQSVAACACGRAAEMREEMRGMVEGGMTGEAVIASYVAQHGEKIRIAPEAHGFNLLAWVGPLILLLAGMVGLVLLIRRWSGRREAEAGDTAPPALEADDPYVGKLRRELEDLQ